MHGPGCSDSVDPGRADALISTVIDLLEHLDPHTVDATTLAALSNLAGVAVAPSARGAPPASDRESCMQAPFDSLTSREREIVVLVADGLTNREIAERLYLAEKTVKNYMTGMLTKLGLQRRTRMAVQASEWLHTR
jgi:DNA-binding NarL/FixJ family response regulator